VQTFTTNIIVDRINDSQFETQVFSAKAKEVSGLDEHGPDQQLQPGQML